MADREPDPDNWFDEPDVSDAWEARSERLARSRAAGPAERGDGDNDDWLSPAAAESKPRTRSTPNRRQVALAGAAVLALALLLGILAAAGVFSSGGKPAGLPPTTAPTTTTPTVSTTPTTTAAQQPTLPAAGLKPGAKGSGVKQLQRALKSAGYSPGTIDGSYGPSTESAVKQFQQAHGLVADGIAGSKTIAALRSALP